MAASPSVASKHGPKASKGRIEALRFESDLEGGLNRPGAVTPTLPQVRLEQAAQKAREDQIYDNADPDRGLCVDDIERIRNGKFNELVEDEESLLLKFLGYFWGPMPAMIWVAIIIELVKGITVGEGWVDFGVLVILQVVNGMVGFMEERNAGNAIAALKNKLVPQCTVVRHSKDGNVVQLTIPSRELVVGDVVELKLGDVVPADMLLIGNPNDQNDQLKVDESALTGESLPKTVYARQPMLMSAMVKQGEMKAVVTAIGEDTFFGRSADLIGSVGDVQSRFQKVLFRVTLGLLGISLTLCAIIFFVLLVGHGQSINGREHESKVLNALSIIIVLLVASIPIAMQVVSTSTMAIGSRLLSEKQVIVARLGAIEELAGMTVLCSDKTGTLTLNELQLERPIIMNDMTPREFVFHAALAANRRTKDPDPIDTVITNAVPKFNKERPKPWTADKLKADFEVLNYVPFNPVIKRTEATIRQRSDGRIFKVTKGAPQVVLQMCLASPGFVDPMPQGLPLERVAHDKIQELADRGLRGLSLAVCERSSREDDTPEEWSFCGILSLLDPPRPDTKETIKAVMGDGVEVKMITGDQSAIAVEMCRRLDMGTSIFNTDILNSAALTEAEKSDRIFNANGFAEVMPEHKYQIVQTLRERGLVVGMTGDGVNDAPALKRADIGIAVDGASDAAKAAADIVLTEPGLSVIIDAIRTSRKIFQRMRNYAIYRISSTVQLLLFFFFAIVTINAGTRPFFHWNTAVDPPQPYGNCEVREDAYFDSRFTLPVLSLVLITILNDVSIITIAHDKVAAGERPQQWNLTEVSVISFVLGSVALIGSMLLLVFGLQSNCTQPEDKFWGVLLGVDHGEHGWYVTYKQLQTIMFLKVAVSDFMTVFAARTRSFFWERRPGRALAVACAFATGTSTIIALFWPASVDPAMSPLSRSPYAVITVWVLDIVFFVLQDLAKVLTYWILDNWVNNEQAERHATMETRSKLTNQVAAMRRGDGHSRYQTAENDLRMERQGSLVRQVSLARLGSSGDSSALEARVDGLTRRMDDMSARVDRMMAMMERVLAAQAGGAAGVRLPSAAAPALAEVAEEDEADSQPAAAAAAAADGEEE